jgi:hypothetical protein
MGNIPYWKIRADPRAIEFYKELNYIIEERDRDREEAEERLKKVKHIDEDDMDFTSSAFVSALLATANQVEESVKKRKREE